MRLRFWRIVLGGRRSLFTTRMTRRVFGIRRFRLLLLGLILRWSRLGLFLRLLRLLLTRSLRLVDFSRLRKRLLLLGFLLQLLSLLCGATLVAALIARSLRTSLVAALIAAWTAIAVGTFASIAILLRAGLRTRRLRCRRRIAAEQAFEPAHQTAGFGRGCRLLYERGRGRRRWRCNCLGCGGARRFVAVLAIFAYRCRTRRFHVGHRGRCRHVEIRFGQGDRRELARRTALVARLRGLFGQLVVADAGDFVMRRMQRFVGDDHDRRVVALFDLTERTTFFVEQIVGDFDRNLHQHLAGAVLHRVFFGQTDDRQRQRFDAAHTAVAVASRAYQLAGLAKTRAQALAGHFHQPELGDAAKLHAGAVVLQRLRQFVLDVALMLVRSHVDEVDHHQAAKIAQPHLTRDFFGRFQIGVERGLFDIAALGGARGVHVDRGQRFGLIDHQRAARRQAHRTLIGVLDLRFDLETVEQRGVVGVGLEFAQILRHHLLDERFCLFVHLGRVDQDLADIGPHVVAQRADDQPRFLIDQERRACLQGGFGDRLPDAEQVIEIPLQLFGVTTDAGGADDHAHIVWDGQYIHRRLQCGAVVALDSARDAAGGGRIGHQHHIAAGQRDERCKGRAFVAALFLIDLDDDLLAFAQKFLDAGLVMIDAGLEVISRNFLQRQKAVLVSAVLDECRFQRRFQAGNAAFINVGFLLFFGRPFDIDIVKRLAVDDRDAQFFCLRRIDEHAFHVSCVPRASSCCKAGARHAVGVFASGDCRRHYRALVPPEDGPAK